jgi:hypothetical protein
VVDPERSLCEIRAVCSERVEPERVDVDCRMYVLCELAVVLRVAGRGSGLEFSALVLLVVLRVTARGSGLEFSALVLLVVLLVTARGSGLEVAPVVSVVVVEVAGLGSGLELFPLMLVVVVEVVGLGSGLEVATVVSVVAVDVVGLSEVGTTTLFVLEVPDGTGNLLVLGDDPEDATVGSLGKSLCQVVASTTPSAFKPAAC